MRKQATKSVRNRLTSSNNALFEPLEGRQLFSGGLTFNLTYDSSVTNLPYAAQVESACAYAAQQFSSRYSDSITVNFKVYANSGTSLGGSSSTGHLYSYAQVRSALLSHKTSTLEAQADSTLPTTDPTAGGSFYVPFAQERALGLRAASSSDQDGSFTFNPNQSYTFDSAHRAVSGKYDFIGVAEHEFSELLGRVSGLGSRYSIFDMFRDKGLNTRSLSATDTNAYFSIDSGQTNIKAFNSTSPGDLADWKSGTNDSFNAFGSTGVVNDLSKADTSVMDVIGYRPYVDDISAKFAATASQTDAYGHRVSDLLGASTSAELDVAGIPGARVRKYQGNDAIYWSYHGGAHVIYGAIGDKYAATASQTDAYGNNVQRILGLPTSDEMNVPGVAGGRMNTFQGGTIYWSPKTGAHVVYGAIGGKYAATAGQTDAYGNNVQRILGLPTSDEINVSGIAGGRMNTFQGGTIYWSARTGAHVVYGGIGGEYAATASKTDAFGKNVQLILGLPTSDEINVPGVAGARMNTFQGGTIYWSPATGAHVVYGGIGGLYNSLGGPTSSLGLPTGDEQAFAGVPGGRITFFQHGAIGWTSAGGAFLLP